MCLEEIFVSASAWLHGTTAALSLALDSSCWLRFRTQLQALAQVCFAVINTAMIEHFIVIECSENSKMQNVNARKRYS